MPREIQHDSSSSCEFAYAECDDAAAVDTNNSMPMADKPYDPPTLPEVINAYNYDLGPIAVENREGFRPMRRNYTTLFFRIRRKNYEQLLWQLFTTGVIEKTNMYMPEALPYWTVGMRLRVKNNYPLGRVLVAMKSRLGIMNPGLRFCIDGFYGMTGYSDIFSNTSDSCPWMEMSNFSTIASLRMADGDSIFISIATSGQIENVNKWRRNRSLELAAAKPATEETDED